jgi:DNA-binding NarL/FixJ family response regulator
MKARKLDSSEATQRWNALLAGRWSLLDQFESGNSLYYVAIRNNAECANSSQLTEWEERVCQYAALGHSNKLIAYELAVSVSFVARQLASASKKLAVRTRVELVQTMQRRRLAMRGPG